MTFAEARGGSDGSVRFKVAAEDESVSASGDVDERVDTNNDLSAKEPICSMKGSLRTEAMSTTYDEEESAAEVVLDAV